jgi:hypothetical protein
MRGAMVHAARAVRESVCRAKLAPDGAYEAEPEEAGHRER